MLRFNGDTKINELYFQSTTAALMWVLAFGILGIVCIGLGFSQESKGNSFAPMSFGLGGLLLLLAVLGPLGVISYILKDTNDFDRQGNPNYWYNLQTGQKYHMNDSEVAGCKTNIQVISVNGSDLRTCTIFGTGAGLLYPGIGTIIEVNYSLRANSRVKSGTKGTLIWPGDIKTISHTNYGMDRGSCWDAFAKDQNGNVMGSATGLEYRMC